MKKILMLFILFMSFGLTAETGYKGNRWYIDRDEIVLQKNYCRSFSDAYLPRDARAEKMLIFDSDIVVYYHMTCGMFVSVSYTLPRNKVYEFKNQNLKKVEERRAESFTPTDMSAYIQSLGKNSDGAFFDYYSNRFIIDSCYNIQGPVGLYNDNGRGMITKYNYNEDTWLYLLENIVMGYNYVVYVTK